MVAHPKDLIVDGRPEELISLEEAMIRAPLPPNWILTEAEKNINREVLLTLEAICKWSDLKFAGLLLRNAIAAARFDDRRARPRRVD
jgi:hypothetical protein